MWVASGKIDAYNPTKSNDNEIIVNADSTESLADSSISLTVPTSDLTSLISVSGDGQWFATAELNGVVRIYHFDSMKVTYCLHCEECCSRLKN